MGLTERECWFWLCSRPYLGVKSIDKLLGYFGTAGNIYYGRNGQYSQVKGLKSTVLKQLQKAGEKDEEQIRKSMERLGALGGRFVCRADRDYPERLRHIYDAPAGLFYCGELPEPRRPMIGIVGARSASSYGLAAAEYFASVLSGMGFGIVSGLARGIDGAAHQGALRQRAPEGKTWGILGCGLNICYPQEHFKIFRQMKKRGGIISEYPLDSVPEAWHFPMRNRIISGLADGILIIEARERSGALITADMGLEQGKNIYALPGPFNSALSAGCHHLIQSGAKLVFRPEDISEDYVEMMGGMPVASEDLKLPLDNSEQLVYASLRLNPKDVNTISAECGRPLAESLHILLNLELKGMVRQMGKNLYIQKL